METNPKLNIGWILVLAIFVLLFLFYFVGRVGYSFGHIEGHKEGFTKGLNEGYKRGYSRGEIVGLEEGFCLMKCKLDSTSCGWLCKEVEK